MRNRYLLLAALVAALAVAAVPALAGVQGTAHQTSGTGAQGVCSACHIPHGGTAGATSRLWPVAPTTTGGPNVAIVGTVASLCASCHLSTGAYNGVAGMSSAFSDLRAYHQLGHGGQMTVADMPAGNSMGTSGLPYVTGTTLECTSCHDVHNDANRPFLRAEMDALCSYCHSLRAFNGGAGQAGSSAVKGAWGSGFVGNANPGSHPVGTDITGDVFGGASPITLAGNFVVPKTTAPGTWSLGGHLADNNGTGNSTGGVTCNSCHAVHGIDVEGGGASAAPTANFLVVAQSSGGNEGQSGRTISSGDGSAGNDLCEACHTGPAPAGYGGTRRVNPGNGTGTHPVDDYASTYEAVGAFQSTGNTVAWPASSTASGTGNAAICESCHTPHPRANLGRSTIRFAAGTTVTPYILRDGTVSICGDCHITSITRHHPVGGSMTNAMGGTGHANYLPGYSATSTTLTCGTCHGGGGGGAHNWTGQGGVGMASSWKPANNARTAGTNYRFAASPNPVATQDISSTCIDCHLDLDGNAANTSPTIHNGTLGYGGTSNAVDVAEYTNLGTGSHYIGPVAAAWFTAKSIPTLGTVPRSQLGPAFNAFTDNWTTANFGANNAAGGISRFGGTSAAPILVCESCHNLVPSRNVGNHMLLAQHFEGQSSVSGITYDTFCEGCHGNPTGTHQQTGDNVARTNAQLNTQPGSATRPWIRSGAPAATPTGGAAGTSTWLAGNPGTGQMTCESCHQVHDANTQGASLILEAPNANVTGGSPVAITVTGTPQYYGGSAINYRLKQLAPAVGTMPDVSMFCDQCHTYRQ